MPMQVELQALTSSPREASRATVDTSSPREASRATVDTHSSREASRAMQLTR